MNRTVALQAGGFLILLGFVLGALGFGSQTGLSVALLLVGGALSVLPFLGSEAPRYVPIPVRARRRGIRR